MNIGKLSLEQIKERLENKYKDESVLKIVAEFVYEFQETLGEFLTTEEVIKRVEQNINTVKIVNSLGTKGQLEGRANPKEKNIELSKICMEQDAEHIKFVFFHEALHMITSKTVGDKSYMGFYDNNNHIGNGFNEGLTEYLTMLRNQRLGIDINTSYKVVVDIMERLMMLIGEDVIIDMYFNNPENFKNLIESFKMDYDELDEATSILAVGDDDIFNISNNMKLSQTFNYNLRNYSLIILKNFRKALGTIKTPEEFEKKYNVLDMNKNEISCLKSIKYEYFNFLNQDLIDLNKANANLTEIDRVLDKFEFSLRDFQDSCELRRMFAKSKNRTDLAIMLWELINSDREAYFRITEDNYILLFEKLNDIINGYSPDEGELYDTVKYAIAGKFLKENPEYDFDELSMLRLNIGSYGCIYELGTSDGKKFLLMDGCGEVEKQQNGTHQIKLDNGIVYEIYTNQNGEINWKAKAPDGVELYPVEKEYFLHSQIEKLEEFLKEDEVNKNDIEKKIQDIQRRIEIRRNKTINDATGNKYPGSDS